jgi:NAD(P)H-hydrate repair Nnr-like enzyme with NAD(P)H-hydrate dehydratase domain
MKKGSRDQDKNLLVKAAVDHIVVQGQIIATVSEPNVPELEAIGGTGDTLTGIVSALVASRFELPRAMILAAKANRIAGSLAKPTVATPITSLIDKISEALGEVLEGSARPYSPSST